MKRLIKYLSVIINTQEHMPSSCQLPRNAKLTWVLFSWGLFHLPHGKFMLHKAHELDVWLSIRFAPADLTPHRWHLHASPTHICARNLYGDHVALHRGCLGSIQLNTCSLLSHIADNSHMPTAPQEVPAACVQVRNHRGPRHASQL